MKILLAPACVAAIGLGLALHGRQGKDPYYQQAPDQVSMVIDKADLPMAVFGVRAATARHWRADAATSMWALQGKDNIELLRLSASTIAEGGGTRVHYDVLPPESALREQVAMGLKENGAYRELYLSALAEQIDAKLGDRKFDIQRISSATARVALSALAHVSESAEAAVAENNRRRQEVIDRVYANEK